MTYFVSIVMQDFFVRCNILERAVVVTQLRPLKPLHALIYQSVYVDASRHD